jgi:Tfp pilus assembly protein FimT
MKSPSDQQRMARSSRGAGRRAGFLLIEYLGYIALLTVLLGLAFGAFYQLLSTWRDLTRNTEDILHALATGERWRADMRQAIAPPITLTEGGTTVWEIPQAQGRVAYVLAQAAIWRQEGSAPAKQLLGRVKSARLERDARGGVVSWRWELELASKKKIVRVRPRFTFQAVANAKEP